MYIDTPLPLGLLFAAGAELGISYTKSRSFPELPGHNVMLRQILIHADGTSISNPDFPTILHLLDRPSNVGPSSFGMEI